MAERHVASRRPPPSHTSRSRLIEKELPPPADAPPQYKSGPYPLVRISIHVNHITAAGVQDTLTSRHPENKVAGYVASELAFRSSVVVAEPSPQNPLSRLDPRSDCPQVFKCQGCEMASANPIYQFLI